MKSYEFLFWAYNVIWAGLAGFLLLLIVRLTRMDRRLDSVEKAIRSRSDGESS
jgi:CcmD family protein